MRVLIRFTALALILAALFSLFAFASDEISFVKQPKGGTAETGSEFEVTFQTDKECRVLLQERDGETYDWGNIDYVTSPFTKDFPKGTYQFRLVAYNDAGDEFYSDVFSITWKNADDMTEVTVEDIDFGAFAYGSDVDAVPVVIRNTGKYALRSPSAELAEETYLELIQNAEPHDIKPGETDSTTWSVRPLLGVGTGEYRDSVFIRALNVEENIVSNVCTFEVYSDGSAPEYAVKANDIDFGKYAEGYTDSPSRDLIVAATGNSNLHNVHLKLNSPDFFTVQSTRYEISELKAGTNTGKNWTVVLTAGMPAGKYEHVIEIYADELETPYKVTVKAVVGEPGDTDDGSRPASGKDYPWWIFIVAAAAVCAASYAVVTVIKKKK